jgi:hypothetical protein
MRFVLYHGIVTRLEIRASEKHEMKNGAKTNNPPICTGAKVTDGPRNVARCTNRSRHSICG